MCHFFFLFGKYYRTRYLHEIFINILVEFFFFAN